MKLHYFIWPLLLVPSFAVGQDVGSLRKQKPFSLSGGVSISTNGYQAINMADRRQPFTWAFSASPTVRIYGLSFPFQVFISSQTRQLGTPFSRYGASPSYKWAKLHLGWRTLNFGQFTLGGQQILGGGAELTPGKWRLGVMYGTFLKGISGANLQQARDRDSTYITQLRPQFARRGVAAKFGYGSAGTFIEANYLQAQDELGYLSDSLANRYRLAPAFNQVLGLNTRLGIGSFYIQAEAALSHYVRDLRTDTLPLKTIFGSNNSALKLLTTIRTSSQLTTALQASTGFQHPNFGLALTYRRIDPDFKSMGVYFIQSDIEQLTVAPNLNLFAGKFSLNGSLGVQRDNLSKSSLNNSNRTIGSLNVSINPAPAFGLDLQFANFGITQNRNADYVFQQPTGRPQILDSLRIQQVSNSFTAIPRFTLQRASALHILTLMASYQANTDNNLYTRTAVNALIRLGTFTYLYTYVPKRLSLTAALNYVANSFGGIQSVNYGGSLGIGKPMLTNQLNTSLNATYYQNFTNEMANGYTVNLNGGATYRYQKRQTVSLSAAWVSNHLTNTSVGLNVRNFSEINGSLRYSLTF